MSELNTKFSVRQPVTVVPLGRAGMVEAIIIEAASIKYRVLYWDCSERKLQELYEFELAAIPPKTT